MIRSVSLALAVFLCSEASVAMAGDFDGSKKLICAPVLAMDCSAGAGCTKGLPNEIGAPAFMRIDFAKKEVIGPQRTSEIHSIEKSTEQVVLRGSELGFAWTMAVGQLDGGMSLSLVDSNGVFVLFGSCTPL
jgi:hypothetical protein